MGKSHVLKFSEAIQGMTDPEIINIDSLKGCVCEGPEIPDYQNRI